MIIQVLSERKKGLEQVLIEQAGNSPLEDRYHCGYLAAINDILNVDVEEITVD